MDKLTYYALTGMLAVENNAIETLKKRLSIIVGRFPGLRNIMIEGVAVSVHIFSKAKMLHKNRCCFTSMCLC